MPWTSSALYYPAKSYLRTDLSFRPRSVPDAHILPWRDAPFRLGPLTNIRQAQSLPRFRIGPVLSSNEIALSDGTASESLQFIFEPEPGKTASDYSFTFVSSNQKTLLNTDITLGATQSIASGYNMTASIDFNRWVGQTDIRIVATDKNSSSTTTSSSTTATIIGMTFFRKDASGNETIVGGTNYPLKLTTEEVRNNSKIDLNVFIQYPDGTDSIESLNTKYPMSGLKITPSSVEQQITHDSSTCANTGNTFNGTTVLLGSSCAFGFSQNDVNSTYVGPKFGLQLNPNRNGSFDMRIDWNGLVDGSSLESVGFDSSINVEITGESYPVVNTIFPPGPFNNSGKNTFSIIVDNLPAKLDVAESWKYNFSIIFTNGTIGYATLSPGGIVVNSNQSVSLNFTLPNGSGYDLAWDMKVTKPTGEILPADDQTKPPYRFNLDSFIRLDSISPTSGSERGGETINLTGDFPNFDPTIGVIYFDGKPIPRTSIISYGNNYINFTLPAKTSTGFNVSVTVGVDGVISNPQQFTYIPATKIVSILPDAGPVTGGSEVALTGQFIGFNLTNSGIFFGGVQLNSSSVVSANDTTIVFKTPPKSNFANDTSYKYDVAVKIKDEISNSVQFSYQVPLTIDSIKPNSGPEQGGTEITLSGSFPTFTKEDGVIYFGGLKLNASNIVSFTNDTIILTVPPRSVIGSSYSQPIWVVALGVESNKVAFNYWNPKASVGITPTGASYDGSTGRYVIGPCGVTDYRASLSHGAYLQNPAYSWTLVDATTNQNILEGTEIVTNEEILALPHSIYPQKNTNYTLTLTVKTDFTTSLKRSITLVQSNIPSIGVRVIDPRPVSVSNPNVTLTIPAIITTPSCSNTDFKVNDTSISYIWSFRNKSYPFSYLNMTAPKGIVGPTLLGREFQVPQKFMEYGSFPLSLVAFFTNAFQVRGGDSTIVRIQPAPLVAQINGGERTQSISEGQDFQVTAERSRDPDILVGDNSVGLRYEWSCMYSADISFATNTTCDDTLLPSISSKKFTVTSSSLSRIKTAEQDVYLRYLLLVRKSSRNATEAILNRASSLVSSVLVIPKTAGQKFEALMNIAITNNEGNLVDRVNVKYFQEVIITPISKTNDTTWQFELVEPRSEVSLLVNPSNLIPYSGFYSIDDRANRNSLGFNVNKLTPNTVYTFRILSMRPGFDRNEQLVSFKTVEKPRVVISHLPRTNGSINSVFYAAATTNYDGDFKYFFIVTDQFGYEYCVDGCQGSKVARFQLASSGNYSLRCDVYDSLGYTMLTTVNSSVGITVVPRSPELTLVEMSALSDDAFKAGDHALYQQYANDMVKKILETNRSTANPVVDSDIVMNITRRIGQITANSVPNAIQSVHYVRTASSLARLSPAVGINLELSSLYGLVNITENAIVRTPDTVAMQQLEDLLQFYDLTPQLLKQIFSQNTTSASLLRSNATSPITSVIWADIFELMKKQVVVISMKGAVCGARRTVRSGSGSKAGNALALRYITARKKELEIDVTSYQEEKRNGSMNPTQGQLLPSLFTVAKLCNPEQDLELFINEKTADEVRFKSCQGIFKNSFRDLLFSVSSTTDYVWLSQLQQVETRTPGLVSVSVSELAKGNTLVEDTSNLQNCFEIEMPVSTAGRLGELNSKNGTPIAAVRFANPRVFGDPIEKLSAFYRQDRKDTTSRITSKRLPDGTDSGERSRIRASHTGIYGVKAVNLGESLRGVRWLLVIILGMLAITLIIVALIVVLVHCLTRGKAVEAPGMMVPVDTEFTYVERDIYGRGTAVEVFDPQENAATGVTGSAAAAANAAAPAAGAAPSGASHAVARSERSGKDSVVEQTPVGSER